MNRPSYGGTVLQRYAQIFHRPIRIKRQRIIVNIKLNNSGFTFDEYAGNQAKLSLKTVVKRKQSRHFLPRSHFLLVRISGEKYEFSKDVACFVC